VLSDPAAAVSVSEAAQRVPGRDTTAIVLEPAGAAWLGTDTQSRLRRVTASQTAKVNYWVNFSVL